MDYRSEFENKVAIVTGGAQGIGRAVTEAFAQNKARVVLADSDAEAAGEEVNRLQQQGFEALFVRTDVAVEEDVKHLIGKVLNRFGRIDVLVNNAGIFTTTPLMERSMEEWDRVVSVNLRGPYMMARYAAQALQKAAPGVIVNIASTRALMSEPNTEPYSASKGGILALTHSLAVSLGPSIRVNSISPGWIEVSDWQKESRRTLPGHRPQDLSQHPAGRVGTPQDIAQACLFLAGPGSGFITGANLVVDGGMTVKMIYEE
ncbi:glucose 1-dehydrogenase [Alicyclobacillus tolerans]|uniref:glucose 1-dehydrogenase n=1 Tax=Alicyclobacillus tolerans TaxID=90970 RepID=UPI001F03251B|nr:glucose 1-dehydrogenase [Alicyclobacillus tolerans]MCF8563954.1 glucose 1-dehydrogenase [Alicyclobacillus tolerans]